MYTYCCSSRTSPSWWITHSTQRHRSGCNTPDNFLIPWVGSVQTHVKSSKTYSCRQLLGLGFELNKQHSAFVYPIQVQVFKPQIRPTWQQTCQIQMLVFYLLLSIPIPCGCFTCLTISSFMVCEIRLCVKNDFVTLCRVILVEMLFFRSTNYGNDFTEETSKFDSSAILKTYFYNKRNTSKVCD